MKTQKSEPNNARLVVKALMAGKPLKPREISELIFKKHGIETDPRYVSRLLSRISNKDKTDLSYILEKIKKGNSYIYTLATEALQLPEDIIYGLTIRTGKDAYSLEQVVTQYPDLKKYIKKRSSSTLNKPSKTKINNHDLNVKDKKGKKEVVVPEIIDIPPDFIMISEENTKMEKEQKNDKKSLVIRPITTLVPVLNPGIPVFEERIPGPEGTMIHYVSIGEGDLTIAACNGIGVSTFFWKFIVNYFSSRCRIILWDYRSHGKSDPAPDLQDLTMDNCAKDLKYVLDHTGVDKALLIGHSMGTQVIFEFYRLYPERVLGLVPLLGSYGNPLSTFLNTDKMIYVINAMYYLSFAFPWLVNPILSRLIFNPLSFLIAKVTRLVNWQHCKYQELKPYLMHLSSLDQRAFFGMAVRMQEHSARDILPDIKVPTLIIAGENDLFTPLRISDEMYKLIPDAEMMIIPCGSHAAIIEQPELINLRVDKFINEKLGGTNNNDKKNAAELKHGVQENSFLHVSASTA